MRDWVAEIKQTGPTVGCGGTAAMHWRSADPHVWQLEFEPGNSIRHPQTLLWLGQLDQKTSCSHGEHSVVQGPDTACWKQRLLGPQWFKVIFPASIKLRPWQRELWEVGIWVLTPSLIHAVAVRHLVWVPGNGRYQIKQNKSLWILLRETISKIAKNKHNNST